MVGCVLSVFWTQAIFAAPLNVTVVLSEEGGAYQEFGDALRNRLSQANVLLDFTSINQPVRDSDLIIAVGMKAATALAKHKSAAIFNVFIPQEGYSRLQQEFARRADTFSAIYLDQPIERQLNLIGSALPNIRHIGILYTTPPNNLHAMREFAAKRKMTVHEQMVTPENSLSRALQELLRNSEVILALPDAEIYNAATIRNILLATYRANVPIIGFSANFVRAGGLCAVFSTPAQIATQAASAIIQYADTHSLPTAQYAHEFEVLVNAQVTRSLNLNLPSSTALQKQIGGRP